MGLVAMTEVVTTVPVFRPWRWRCRTLTAAFEDAGGYGRDDGGDDDEQVVCEGLGGVGSPSDPRS